MRGIFRLSNFKIEEDSDYNLFALWSQNRAGRIQGIYSHETALNIFGLSDVNPSKIHMTVPKNFRKGSKIPKVLELHYENLESEDYQEINGYFVTKPFKAILDSMPFGLAPPGHKGLI